MIRVVLVISRWRTSRPFPTRARNYARYVGRAQLCGVHAGFEKTPQRRWTLSRVATGNLHYEILSV